MARSDLLAAILALACVLARASSPSASPQEEPLGEADVATLAARNHELEFTTDSARRARATLERGLADPEERALAWLALGAAGVAEDLARLVAAADAGPVVERRAALLALGERGSGGTASLAAALEAPEPELREAACLGLALAARAGSAGARERLELARAAELVMEPARAALAFLGGDDALPWTELESYYRLRWRAAGVYGRVDATRSRRARALELCRDADFLERVVLGSAHQLPEIPLRSHLHERVLAGESNALCIAALVMPEALVHALEAGVWKPSGEDWRAVLEEIRVRGAERKCRALLEAAFRLGGELDVAAGTGLLRGGSDLPWSWVEHTFANATAAERAALLEAVGERGERARAADLAGLLLEARAAAESDPGMPAEGRIALARLGHEGARDEIDSLVKGPASSARAALLPSLARVLHDRSLVLTAEEALRREDLAPEERFGLEVALARNGSRAAREKLRASLGALQGDQRRSAVEALARGADPADLAALAELFPPEGDAQCAAEIAGVLLNERHPGADGILRAALWRAPWSTSVLAGGLIQRFSGRRGLLDELDVPPLGVREADLRRVGFALGEWGGFGAVEELLRSRGETDPALQGALLGALSTRAATPEVRGTVRLGTPRTPSSDDGFDDGLGDGFGDEPGSAEGSKPHSGKGKKGGKGGKGRSRKP